MNWNDLQYEKSYSKITAYMQAKLANILFTRELAYRFGNQGITAVSLHPGVILTEFGRDFEKKFWFKIVFFFTMPFIYMILKNCKEGAQTTIHCAIDESVEQFNGEYFTYNKNY